MKPIKIRKMTELNFFERTGRQAGNNGGHDLWVRKSEKGYYVALKRKFAEMHLNVKGSATGPSGKNFVTMAFDLTQKVAVGNVNHTVVPVRACVVMRGEGENGGFYCHQLELVDEFQRAFLVNTEVENTYFKLEPAGSYNGFPRFNIVKL